MHWASSGKDWLFTSGELRAPKVNEQNRKCNRSSCVLFISTFFFLCLLLPTPQDRCGPRSLVESACGTRTRGEFERAPGHQHTSCVSRRRHQHGIRKCTLLMLLAYSIQSHFSNISLTARRGGREPFSCAPILHAPFVYYLCSEKFWLILKIDS